MAQATDERVELVDPFIGVRIEGTIIGPTLPHGSIHPSPQSLFNPGNDGYNPDAPISGFAHLHVQGTGGTPSYGNILVSPQVGLAVREPAHTSWQADEIARIDYYATTLTRYDIRCEVTPTHHAAIYRFTYPDSGARSVVLNVARKIRGQPSLEAGELTVDPEAGEITGGGHYAGNWRGIEGPIFYAVRVSESPVGWGTFLDGVATPDDTLEVREEGAATESFGAYLQFAPSSPREIHLKIAVSMKSVEQARHWLDTEIPGWDFDSIRDAATRIWNDALGTIEIEGGTDEQRRIFYTALCRSLTQPRDRTNDMMGFDLDVPLLDDHYTMWDTYRTVWPLLTIIKPSLVADAMESFVATQERFGFVGTAFVMGFNHPVSHQGGTEVDNIIGDAYLKGIPLPDWGPVYEVMRHNAENERPEAYLSDGYVVDAEGVNAGSSTLAFALNDFCAAQVAGGLDREGDRDRYAERASRWTNVWDPDARSDGFAGFALTRDMGGAFIGDPTSRVGFYEDLSWAYSFFVPHDVHALIDRMEGPARFVERLQHGFDQGYWSLWNEPGFLVPWLTVYAGRPDVSSALVREIIGQFVEDRYPGQEDAGAMSSFYVFAASGLFPNAGQPIYLLHGPLFERIVFNLESGRRFVIEGEGAGPDHPYVQSATLNGAALDRAWITHEEIMRGGTLRFIMGTSPSTWGRDEVPPSPFTTPTPTSVYDPLVGPSSAVTLAVPNPFVQQTTIRVRVSAGAAPATLTVYDVGGRRVRRLVNGPLPAGDQSIVWDGRDDRVREVGAGVYFYVFRQGDVLASNRVVLVR